MQVGRGRRVWGGESWTKQVEKSKRSRKNVLLIHYCLYFQFNLREWFTVKIIIETFQILFALPVFGARDIHSSEPLSSSCRMKWNLIKTQIEFLRARHPPLLTATVECVCARVLLPHASASTWRRWVKLRKVFIFISLASDNSWRRMHALGVRRLNLSRVRKIQRVLNEELVRCFYDALRAKFKWVKSDRESGSEKFSFFFSFVLLLKRWDEALTGARKNI